MTHRHFESPPWTERTALLFLSKAGCELIGGGAIQHFSALNPPQADLDRLERGERQGEPKYQTPRNLVRDKIRIHQSVLGTRVGLPALTRRLRQGRIE